MYLLDLGLTEHRYINIKYNILWLDIIMHETSLMNFEHFVDELFDDSTYRILYIGWMVGVEQI